MSSCYICGEGVIEIAAASVQNVMGLSDSAQRLLQKRKLLCGSVQLPAATRNTFAQCDSCKNQFGTGAATLGYGGAAIPVVGEYYRLCNTKGDGGTFSDVVSTIVSPQGAPPPLHRHSSIDEGIWSLYHAAIASTTSPNTTNGEETTTGVSPQARLSSWKMKSLLSLRYPSVRLEPTTTPDCTVVEQPSATLRLVALSGIEQGATIDLSSVPHNDEDAENVTGAPVRKITNDVLVNPSMPMSNYMTHSCTPNTQLLGHQPTERSIEINIQEEAEDEQQHKPSSYVAAVVVALRDIAPNEPLTIDTEALPPYFKAASIGLRQEELLRRRTIRRAMHMDRGYHFTSDNGTPTLGNCQCEACVGDALLPELLMHNGGGTVSSDARLNTTAFQRILIKEGVVVVGQDAPPSQCRSAQQTLTPTILEKMVCGNVLRYDFSRSFACPLSPLCKDGVVYPSSMSLSVSGTSNNITDAVVWRCDSCLEWWVVNKGASHSALSTTIRSIVRFEEQAIGKAKEALSTIKMLHSGYVPMAEVLPLLDSSGSITTTSGGDAEEVRRRAMASLHHMEEMGNKPLTNKCYTALKDLLQSCVDAGMVMEVTPRESSFDNLLDRNHSAAAPALDGGDVSISANNNTAPHIQSRCSHWVYSSACLYMSLYFSELGTRRLKGEGEQEAALSFAVRWMKLYLRSMLPLSWVGGDNSESGGSSLLWKRSKIAAGGAAMTLARAIRRFPRQYTNAKYLTILAYVSGYITMKMALSKCIAAGSNTTIITADTVEFIKSHNAVQVPEIKEIEALMVSSSITTAPSTNNVSKPVAVSSPTERKGQVWYWLHHGETGFGGAQDDSSTSAAGGGAETHEEVLKDWEEYLMELSREAMTRQQNPNLPPEVVQAMRGLGR